MYSNILCSKINILNVISHELISRKITFSKFEERMFICLGGRGGDIEREEETKRKHSHPLFTPTCL